MQSVKKTNNLALHVGGYRVVRTDGTYGYVKRRRLWFAVGHTDHQTASNDNPTGKTESFISENIL